MSDTTNFANFRFILNLSLAAAFALVMSGCGSGNVSFEKGNTSLSDGGGNGTSGCTANCLPPVAATESFMQSPPQTAVDLLFVIDNSGSMAAVQSKVSNGFNSLITSLNALDWQIGFTTTNINHLNGELAPLVGDPGRILKKGMAQASTIFRNTVSGFGVSGGGDERGIYSATNTVLLGNGLNSSFFRQNSALAIVIVSDEDERSTGGRNISHGGSTTTGPIETNDLPSTLIGTVKNVLGTAKKLSGYGIVVRSGDVNCYNEATQSFYGTFYESFASLTGGRVGSICDTDYSATLSGIGQNIQALINSVTLAHIPIVSSVHVSLIPAQAGISWTVQGDKVVFSRPPVANSRITVSYSWQP